MACSRPITVHHSSTPVSCGKCIYCRVNKRKIWTGRIILEMLCHPNNYFVTLTYDDHHLPENGSLNPDDLQKFIKGVRNKIGSFRYYAVGEYGEQSQRPHYHLCIFTDPPFDINKIHGIWSQGFIQVSHLTSERAAYTARYVLKKLTGKAASEYEGRIPEFSRMSRRNAIGYRYVERLALSYETQCGSAFLIKNGDVHPAFRYKNKTYPLGRFLTDTLRARLGIPLSADDRHRANPNAKTQLELSRELQILQDQALEYAEKDWRKVKQKFFRKSEV